MLYGVCVASVEMRETQGGPNAAVGGTATADSQETSSTSAANGFAGYPSRWQSDGRSGSGYNDAVDRYPHWLAYEFTSPVEIEEVSITGVSGTQGSGNPVKIVLEYSEDGGTTWNVKYSWLSTEPWATDGSDVRVFNSSNAVNEILQTNNLYALSVINYPAEEVRSTAYQINTTFRRMSQELRATGLQMLSLVRGRTYNPKLRAWTFTLDGHDFYVLRLGDEKTLVYDLTTGQWSWWTSGGLPFWRPSVGMNWPAPGSIPEHYGSNVVCGDDTFGHLWILSPEQGYDDSPYDEDDAVRFPRVATTQLITRQRQFLPVYEVYLTGSFGEPVEDGDAVTLNYSDDLGNTFVSAGALAVGAGDFTQEFAWRSLGMIQPSGRLFQIVDYGAFARIDGLDGNVGEVADG